MPPIGTVQMVVVKTASNFQYFADWTEELIRVDTPGHTQSRVTDFDWQRLPRPIFRSTPTPPSTSTEGWIDGAVGSRTSFERQLAGREGWKGPARCTAVRTEEA
jgi:hypothetical protein